jgi:hypothetical protein
MTGSFTDFVEGAYPEDLYARADRYRQGLGRLAAHGTSSHHLAAFAESELAPMRARVRELEANLRAADAALRIFGWPGQGA